MLHVWSMQQRLPGNARYVLPERKFVLPHSLRGPILPLRPSRRQPIRLRTWWGCATGTATLRATAALRASSKLFACASTASPGRSSGLLSRRNWSVPVWHPAPLSGLLHDDELRCVAWAYDMREWHLLLPTRILSISFLHYPRPVAVLCAARWH